MNNSTFELTPIGKLLSPFKEKFGIPRQPGLIQSCSATIELSSPYNNADAVRGLEGFSHIWLIFGFNQHDPSNWKPLIRPPRLGGNQKVGVFASRSSFRPNGLGMSLVELRNININSGTASLEIACPDILDGTPIFDIKPYIAYSDSVDNAICSYANTAPIPLMVVSFSNKSEDILELIAKDYDCNLRSLIKETLSFDPRPAYKAAEDSREYGIYLYDLNIIWKVSGQEIEVISIQKKD